MSPVTHLKITPEGLHGPMLGVVEQ